MFLSSFLINLFPNLNKSSWGTLLLNFIVQRILRVSSGFPYSLHYTSRATSAKNIRLNGPGSLTQYCLAVNGSVYLGGSNGITISNDCLIAPGVKIVSGNHDMNDFNANSLYAPPICIESGCWLGANCIILPSVHLHCNTIVGAGAVVTRSFGIGDIVIAGNPAKIVKHRSPK